MNKILCTISSIIPVFTIGITTAAPPKPILNNINLQLTTTKWATTKTAKVTVAINYAGKTLNLTTLQTNIMRNLNKIASTLNWHITALKRSQDNTGLERIAALAEARLPQNTLTAIYNRAKNLSSPGANYKIATITFTPSIKELQQTTMELRQQIYNLAWNELKTINQIYPKQHFFIHQINFKPILQPQAANTIMLARMATAKTSAANGTMQISKKITLNANVTLAAIPKNKLTTKPRNYKPKL